MLPNSIPDAPWILHGEAALLLASPRHARLLVNYRDSPVGPYREHALGEMTRRGPHIFQMSVDLEASKIGGREIWGFPKTMENLSWNRRGANLEFRREEQDFRLRVAGPSFPIALAFFTVQNLRGADVRVPGQIKARAKIAFRGRQIALFIESFEMKFDAPVPLHQS
ncbi:Acetoacetate decarboxylase (ADC) [Abditibacterium utsteinense]|uniref:Acetoacetate decarboxylase (ADC) n=1 Tax=Abditibacterium utsteinense TaxID=1960156 RepID=A0A2S8SUT9_9BACT|nr:acetoacetate decarboxylase family protein [Abditibacterium utsteinense]PQV64539.1 Acetoacetate decarboxylase (ADC) [Abditibacterium utsteinense]